MYWFKCSLLVAFFSVVYCQDSGSTLTTTQKQVQVNTEIQIDVDSTGTNSTESKKRSLVNSTTDSKDQGLVNLSLTTPETEVNVKQRRKKDVENGTFGEKNPFLLFPFLPFLFPKETKEEKRDVVSKPANESQLKGNAKPFVFFDFAFNIRQTPMTNKTDPEKVPTVISVKKLSFGKPLEEDFRRNEKEGMWRTANPKTEAPGGFFDDFPLFQSSALDDFFSKPDLLFPDFLFRRKSDKKLSRKKKDMKKPVFKNDIKLFFDVIDEAFAKTKRELEQVDPVLGALRGVDGSFGEDKGTEGGFSALRDKPKVKLTVWRNPKQLAEERSSRELPKERNVPVVVVDKVAKTGEVHLHEDKKKQNKKKKREVKEGLMKFLDEDEHRHRHDHGKMNIKSLEEKVDSSVKYVFLPKRSTRKENTQENRKIKKRQKAEDEKKPFSIVQSKDLQILPQSNTSVVVVSSSNVTIEMKKKDVEKKSSVADPNASFKKGLLKVADSTVQDRMSSNGPVADFMKRKVVFNNDKINSTKRTYEDMKRNITDILSKFLVLVKKLDNYKILEKLEASEPIEAEFDWTEKETLQSADDKKSRIKRQSDQNNDDYDDLTDREVANLSLLFLMVTVPSLVALCTFIILCFLNLKPKGKLCTKLFQPRRLFTAEELKKPKKLRRHKVKKIKLEAREHFQSELPP